MVSFLNAHIVIKAVVDGKTKPLKNRKDSLGEDKRALSNMYKHITDGTCLQLQFNIFYPIILLEIPPDKIFFYICHCVRSKFLLEVTRRITTVMDDNILLDSLV